MSYYFDTIYVQEEERFKFTKNDEESLETKKLDNRFLLIKINLESNFNFIFCCEVLLGGQVNFCDTREDLFYTST